MAWQAKTSAGKYLPLFFNDNGVSGVNDVLTSLWVIDRGSLMGASAVALTKDAADDFKMVGKLPAIGGLSLMTEVSSTQAYNNFAAFALYNKSAYREGQGDTFGGSNMHTLKKISNSAISDICLVPYVTCKKFSDAMIDTTAQAGTGGSQTMLLSQYLTGMTGGQHFYEAYPHVYRISFDVYCRVADTPDGFGVDAAHTNRVKIASYGSGTNNIRDGANNALTIVPITSFAASYVQNYFMSNSTIAPEVAIDTGSLYVTGATNRWVFDSFGERSNGLWVTHGGLIDASGLANAACSLGGNLLWAGWNYDSIHVTRIYNTGNAELGGHYTYFSYIDCSSDRSHLIACVNLLGFLWADTTTAAVTARPGDGQTTTHVPDRAGGSKYGMPLGTDHNGANTDPEEESEEYETSEDHEDPDPDPDPTVTPPVGPPTDPNKDEDSAGGGGNTETIHEDEQPDDVTDGNINQIPDVSGTRKYVLSAANVEGLINYLASTYAPTDTDLTADFKGVNPMDYIVSCKWYPFAPSASGTSNITVGGLATTVSGNIFNDYGVRVLYLGGADIKGYYNSWLDFEPYVSMSLYVPFCGTIDLDTKLWMYHHIDVYLAVDYNTGSCAALLMRDGTLTSTIDGVCGIDVQMYGKNQGDYQNAVYAAQFAAKQAKIGEARAILDGVTNPFGFTPSSGDFGVGANAGAEGAAGATGAGLLPGIMAMAGGLGGKMMGLTQTHNAVQAAEWNVTHTAPHVTGAGSQDPFLQLAMPMFCRLYIRRAQMISGFNIGTYRATVGYACMRTGRVGDFRGRIVCSGVWKTDGNLLQAEVDMIKAKLMKGVFVTNPT